MSLEKNMRARCNIINEIMQTETDYLRDLGVMVGFYMRPLQYDFDQQVKVTQYDMNAMFKNVESLLTITKRFLAELEVQETKENLAEQVCPSPPAHPTISLTARPDDRRCFPEHLRRAACVRDLQRQPNCGQRNGHPAPQGESRVFQVRGRCESEGRMQEATARQLSYQAVPEGLPLSSSLEGAVEGYSCGLAGSCQGMLHFPLAPFVCADRWCRSKRRWIRSESS